MRTKEREAVAYRTQDFVTAAYLVCSGFEPRLELVRPGRIEFAFPAEPGLDEAVKAHRRGTARVPPSSFHLCQVELRRRMDEVLGQR